METQTLGTMSRNETRPYYLMVAFWGAKFREYFYSYCLSTLLSPNNLPVLAGIKGCKFLIATSADDWHALQGRPLFERMRGFVEPCLIDIGHPGPDGHVQFHMTKGHQLAARKAAEDGALAGFYAPDLLVSDGTIAFILEKAMQGKRAVLTPAIRYATEPVLDALQKVGLPLPDEALVLPPRMLAGIAQGALHSEIQRYEFDAPYFGDYPIWAWWRVPQEDAIVMHTVSWALLLGDYSALGEYDDRFLDSSTVDQFYIFETFYRHVPIDDIYYSTDSDDLVFLSLTPEAEMTYLPFVVRPINSSAFGYRSRLSDIHRFLHSEVVDDFRRDAYLKPYLLHGVPASRQMSDMARRSQAIVRVALNPGAAEVLVQRIFSIAGFWWKGNVKILAAYPATIPQLILVFIVLGIPSLIAYPFRWIVPAGRYLQSFFLRLLFGRLVRPVMGRLSRRNRARVLRMLPKRLRWPVVWRLRSEAFARARDPLFTLQRTLLRIVFDLLILPAMAGLARRHLAVLVRVLPHYYRRPVLLRVRNAERRRARATCAPVSADKVNAEAHASNDAESKVEVMNDASLRGRPNQHRTMR